MRVRITAIVGALVRQMARPASKVFARTLKSNCTCCLHAAALLATRFLSFGGICFEFSNLMRTMCARGAAAMQAILCFHASVLGHSFQQVAFDMASATSIHPSSGAAPGVYDAEEAILPSGSYWCSSGRHAVGHAVTWTGTLESKHVALGIRVHWAYAPGELKVLISADGANFHEQRGWHRPSRDEMKYEQWLMFDAPVVVRAVALLMRSPRSWSYFGLSRVAVFAEPGQVMIVSGAPSNAAGELCLVAAASSTGAVGSALAVKPCLASIAGGDGSDVFKLSSQGHLKHVPSQLCVSAGGASVYVF